MKPLFAFLFTIVLAAAPVARAGPAAQDQTNIVTDTNAPFSWIKSEYYTSNAVQKVSQWAEISQMSYSLKGKIVQLEINYPLSPRQISDDVFVECYGYGDGIFMRKQASDAFKKYPKYKGPGGTKKYLYIYIPDDILAEKMLKDLQKACPDSDWARSLKLKNALILIGNTARNSFGKIIYEWK